MRPAQLSSPATAGIAPVVAASLITGLVAAIGFIAIPFAGARENVIAGVVLLAFAFGWAMLLVLSVRLTDQPQEWAAVPAGVFALLGGGLLVWPGAVDRDAVASAWPPVLLGLAIWMTLRARRALRSRVRVWLLYPMFGLLAAAAVGGGYETVREAVDRSADRLPGVLVDVGGRQLHLHCIGTGSPTVILLPGYGESSASWGWIAPSVAPETRVCAYDRAGRGGSDPAPSAQDGEALAADLRTLLERAHVAAPYVLAGHSFGGLLALTFAARYPEQVAGVVLLDATHPEMFTRVPAYPSFYEGFRRVSAVFPSLARLGVGRVAYRSSFDSLPPASRDEERAIWSTARQARSQRDEWAEAPRLMRQARSLRSLGDRPLIVVTAARDALDGWLPLQDELAALSTNSVHRVLPNATHQSLTYSERDAAASSRAIRDVVEAVRAADTTR
ncbi:MAG TPA: alpha/beta fold hydrolase [Gemmatimonadaceae bacterium]|nr:alpha/beta fold hydrolase [Gemmatimonadaceae bacterium]